MFLGIVMYAKEVDRHDTKEKQKLPEIKNLLQHYILTCLHKLTTLMHTKSILRESENKRRNHCTRIGS